jgi:hypothetical protein
VPPCDVEALQAGVDRLAQSKELRDAYGARGRERALAMFSERNYTSKLKIEVTHTLQHVHKKA